MTIDPKAKLPSSWPLVLLALVNVLPIAAIGCGPKVFPKCGEPGVECPPCAGNEPWPSPCAMRSRDAGAAPEAGK